jgi:hypothetical protein
MSCCFIKWHFAGIESDQEHATATMGEVEKHTCLSLTRFDSMPQIYQQFDCVAGTYLYGREYCGRDVLV